MQLYLRNFSRGSFTLVRMAELVAADPRVLRAIAHPIRTVLLYELFARGESTATALAIAIDQPVNSVSFHLRQLQRYGVIEEVTGHGGDGRARWWRPRDDRGLRFDEASLREQPDGPGAYEVGMRYFEERWHALVERLFRRRDGKSAEVWKTSDVAMLLTDSEARQMQGELLELQMRWVYRGREAAATEAKAPNGPGAGRRTYLVLSIVMPHPVDLVET